LLGDDARGRLIDPLHRAFDAEERPEVLAPLGATLATLLLGEDRISPAREVVERALGVVPNDLKNLMLLSVLQEQEGAPAAAVETLDTIVEHSESETWIRADGLRRMVDLQSRYLDDKASAKKTASRLAGLPLEGRSALEARLEVEELVDDHEAAAKTLAELAEADDLSPAASAGYLFRLASIQEHTLSDSAAAIESLSRIESTEHQQDAASRLFELGEKSGRWDLSAGALEVALDRGAPVERDWELDARRRLAELFEGPLLRPEASLRHYERIVELDPTDVHTLEHLAGAAGTAHPEKAIDYHRALLRAQPDRTACYRALRKLFLEVGDVDSAFCAEAVLEGLGKADEEESYFYRQRRSALSSEPTAGVALTDADRQLLCPEAQSPAFVLLGELTGVLGKVFPVDYAGYGVDPANPPGGEPLGRLAEDVARVLGVGDHTLSMVAASLGPAVESGTPPILLVPKSLADAAQREQRFVLGSLLARVGFHGIAGDFRGLNPISGKQLEYLLGATCELVVPDYSSPASGNAIFEDIKRRLSDGIDDELKKGLASSAKALADGDPIDGAAVQQTMGEAAARAAMLVCQDPAVGVACLRSFATMFATEDSEEVRGVPRPALQALSFAVSEGHAAMRKSLGLGVSS
jgi:hypothetical protein